MRRVALLLLVLTLPAFAAERETPRLDEQTLRSLSFGTWRGTSLRPGDSWRFQLGVWQCCVWFRPLEVRARWSVDPSGYASIDANGNLRIAANAYNGALVRVYANVENGRRILSTDVHVYTPEANPFVGAGGWRHVGEISCDGGFYMPVSPDDEIREFVFRANGQYEVTWFPFEVYVDYWGPFTFDLNTKRITFGVTYGNYVPDDMDRDGTFELLPLGDPQVINGWNVQNYELRLNSIWLGRRSTSAAPPGCGMVFQGSVYLAPATAE